MSQFPKLLVMQWAVPPAINGSSIIIHNLAQYFSQDEMIVVGAWFAGSPKLEWKDYYPPIIHLSWQPPQNGQYAERRWRWFQFPLVFVRALWIALTRRCEAIMVVFPDETYLLAGYLVSALTGKPLFSYFHNTFVELIKSDLDPNKRIPRFIQSLIFSRSRHVFTMSEGMQQYYQQAYPYLNSSPLLHTFNEQLDSVPSDTSLLQTPTRLIMFGSVNYSNRQAARNIATAVSGMEEVHLTLYSPTDHEILSEAGFIQRNIKLPGAITRHELLVRLKDSDILLFPHGFSEDEIGEVETQTIFPTRTIEYLLAGRPILAHVPADTFLAQFLQKHGCALVVTEPSVEAIRSGIRQLQDDASLRAKLAQNALAAVRQFHVTTVAQRLRDVIIQHCAN